MTAQKILICVHDFSRGGTERIAIGLAANWAAAGRDVTILCGSDEGGLRDTVDGRVKVITLNPPIRRGFLSRFRLGRAMGKQLAGLRPDVIFLPGNFHLLLAGGLRKAASRPVIAAKISNPPLPHAAPFAKPAFRHVTRAVTGFAAMNSGLARDLRALVPGGDIVTLHDPVYIRPTGPVSRKTGRNILWIGRLEPQKDPELALKVLQALGGDAHLTMLGDGALSRKVQGQVSALGLKDKVTLLGHVPDIASHLADADALLITSRYEGGPAVAVEALALGVPVVGTDCSYLLQDLITLPEAGRIVASRDPADLAAALSAVCDQPRPPREKFAALVASFEPDRCAQNYLDWFDRLARERHG
jgi:glycosyltransferase involved in cell wall biosynthesis